MVPKTTHDDETVQGDARLIAAAPDLLEACKKAFDLLAVQFGSTHTVHWPGLATDAGDALIVAIDKAEGN